MSAPQPTEAVCEAALGMVSALISGPMRWEVLAKSIRPRWSHPTLRRACRLLVAAGCVVFDRKTLRWSRAKGVLFPPALWPRRMLVEVAEVALREPALDTPAEL